MPCDVAQTLCSALAVLSCTPSQEVMPCLQKKQGAGSGELLCGALHASQVLAQALPNPVEMLQATNAQADPAVTAIGYEEPGGCSFHGQHREGHFFFILGKRNMLFHFWGKQSLPAPSTLLGIVASKAKKQSKVCLPFPVLFPAVCRSSSFSSYPFPGSQAKQRKMWKWLVV